jgi:hypothetical protein
MVLYGIKQPQSETPESLTKYANEIGLNDSLIIIPKDTTAFYRLYQLNNSVPEIRAFNKRGEMVYYKDSTTCNAPAFSFTDSICFINDLTINTYYSLAKECSLYKNLDGKDLEINSDIYDYTVFIYWAKYLGKLNKDHVKEWQDNLQKQTECSIKIYLANMDIPHNSDLEIRMNK